MRLCSACFGLPFFFAVFLALVAVCPAASQTLLVAPFDNVGGQPNLEWVGESFAEALTDRLAGNGFALVSRAQRLAAMERLGLSATSPLTRASLVRLGEELGAAWVVVGRFELRENRLSVWARLLHLRRLSLSAPLEQKGSFAQLLDIQGALAWQILRTLNPGFPYSRESFLERVQPPPVSALENYLRGLRAPSRELQVRYFLQAARLAPKFSPPAWRLGKIYFEDQDYATAARWLEKIPAEHRDGADARFYLSLSYFFGGDPARAAATLRPLGRQLPVKEVWNNLGVFASQAGASNPPDYFARALREDSADPDVHFNLGLHYLRRRQWTAAAQAFDQCLALNPEDSEARFLSAQVLEALGRPDDAERVRQQALSGNPAPVDSLARQPAGFARLKQNFSAALARRRGEARRKPSDDSARAQHVTVHLERGKDFLTRDQLESARYEFTQMVYLAPSSYEGHFYLAEVYRRQGQASEAISELRAALWSEDTLPVRLRLAELYLEEDRSREAREQVRAALALDPASSEARNLADRLNLALAPAGNGSGGEQ